MSDWLTQQAESLAGQPEFELEKLILSVHRQIVERMEHLQVNRAELAKAMGIGRWSVSRLLNNVSNIELKTLVNAASALQCRINLSLEPLQGVERVFAGQTVATYVGRVEVPARPVNSREMKQIEVSRGISGSHQTAAEEDNHQYATAA